MLYANTLCLIVLTPLMVKAQRNDSLQRNLQTVTIVGDKSKTLPGSGQYINRQTLDKLNQVNVNNVLRLVPGVNIRDEEGFGLRPNIGLRGTAVNRSAKITLMEDGVLIAPATYADPAAYYFPTFARMQGIEVLKGSSQVKYGPYTVGGAVNLLSRNMPNAFDAQALLSYGLFGNNQQQIWLGDSRNHIDYVFEINRIASNGFKQLDGGGPTGFERRDAMAKLRWHTLAAAKVQQSLTLKVVSMNELGHESYLGLTLADYNQNRNRRYAATQRDLLNMNHTHASLTHVVVPSLGLKVQTTAYYSSTTRNWQRVNAIEGFSVNNILNYPDSLVNPYRVMQGLANGSVDVQGANRMYYSTGLQSQANYQFSTRQLEHDIEIGIRLHADQANRYATKMGYAMTDGVMVQVNAGITGNQENQIRQAQAIAGFVSYALRYNKLKIIPGVRVESIAFQFKNYGTNDNARLGTQLSTATNHVVVALPGIGIQYEINQAANAFAGVHKGFSPPGMPVVNNVGEQAQSELSTAYEIGYRYNNTVWHLQTIGFFNNYRNILGSDNVSGGGLGTGNMFNAGNAHIVGLEALIQYNLLPCSHHRNRKLPVGISYTYTQARFQEAFVNAGGDWGSGTIQHHDFIPFITPHLLTFHAAYEHPHWNINALARYTGVTRIKPSQGEPIFPSATNPLYTINALPAFIILDVSANYKVNKSVTLFTQLGNVTNSKAIVANLPQGYRPNMPFSALLGIKANL